MGMNLKNFFDLEKVEFTKVELELPYEDFNLIDLSKRSFSYSDIKVKPRYATTVPPKEQIVRQSTEIGVVA